MFFYYDASILAKRVSCQPDYQVTELFLCKPCTGFFIVVAAIRNGIKPFFQIMPCWVALAVADVACRKMSA